MIDVDDCACQFHFIAKNETKAEICSIELHQKVSSARKFQRIHQSCLIVIGMKSDILL